MLGTGLVMVVFTAVIVTIIIIIVVVLWWWSLNGSLEVVVSPSVAGSA